MSLLFISYHHYIVQIGSAVWFCAITRKWHKKLPFEYSDILYYIVCNWEIKFKCAFHIKIICRWNMDFWGPALLLTSWIIKWNKIYLFCANEWTCDKGQAEKRQANIGDMGARCTGQDIKSSFRSGPPSTFFPSVAWLHSDATTPLVIDKKRKETTSADFYENCRFAYGCICIYLYWVKLTLQFNERLL